ncbi:aldo/keto reductase [Seonamhaeicola aphaedonensis]|uniref:Aryl-alcohol dehydrogenase-like predicted oxidoreductase n=1 Tax=Seonamhaeicola aphaedonensis TaxID=1461338 RepID=A0A3D9HIC2_9FLAO|nr:aldo/keto reductase [Seonamhaeicola aphaedonensis]RED49011.1 aryl-alcohol dehydrogenase-like predicted oxidoreductase [Seonamhaeicola aphaedonensis]
MKERKLGNNGFQTSEIGLGCWQLGGDWGNKINKTQARKILEKAINNGINFFDTADVYGDGRSEEVIGEFIQQSNIDVKVATKFGRNANVYPNNYSEQALRKSVDNSRKRLNKDCIDLLQLHCIPTEELKKGAIFDWLRTLKNEGKIAHFGASVESVNQGLICLEQEGLQSLQVIYNIFRQKLTHELLPCAYKKGVGIIVRLPLASGLLSGKFTSQTEFKENDHRNFNRNGEAFNVGETFAGLPFKIGVQLSDELKAFCPENLSILEMSLRWILDHKEVTTIIPGASSTKQVIENSKISNLPSLSSQLMKQLEDFYHNKIHSHIRGVY